MEKALAKRVHVLLCVVCVFCLSVTLAQESHSDPAHSWRYAGERGPEHWGDLSPEFAACAIGKAQSPIDIRDPYLVQLPPINFSYRPSPLKVINNGHTIQINYTPGSTITIGDKTYELMQFHFHHPSEEMINGQAYPLVAHLVHKNNEGKLAVIAVMIQEGNSNQLISSLWHNLPPNEGKELSLDDVKVDVNDLLPTNHAYYTFAGSLTTPPCSEGVTWYVLQTPMPISKTQIDRFATIYPLNARPIQPLNNRIVQKSE